MSLSVTRGSGTEPMAQPSMVIVNDIELGSAAAALVIATQRTWLQAPSTNAAAAATSYRQSEQRIACC